MSERKIRVSPIKGAVGPTWNSFALFELGFGELWRKPHLLIEGDWTNGFQICEL